MRFFNFLMLAIVSAIMTILLKTILNYAQFYFYFGALFLVVLTDVIIKEFKLKK